MHLSAHVPFLSSFQQRKYFGHVWRYVGLTVLDLPFSLLLFGCHLLLITIIFVMLFFLSILSRALSANAVLSTGPGGS